MKKNLIFLMMALLAAIVSPTIEAQTFTANNLAVNGTSSMTGAATFGSTTSHTGAATFTGSAAFGSTTTHTGAATFNGAANFNGTNTFTGAITGAGLLPISQVVTNVAGLRAVNHLFASSVVTKGYASVGDGGDARYTLISGTTGSYTDNGCTVIVASDGAVWGLNFSRQIGGRQCGLIADGNVVAGTGTDNSTKLQNVITLAAASSASVFVQAGNYRLASTVNIPSNFALWGAGPYQTVFFATSAFTSANGLIRLNGTGGPPTTVADLAILSANGGAGAGSVGLNSIANGAFMHGLWVGGFATNIVLGQSDNFLYDSVSEQALSGGVGIAITSTDVSVSNVETYNDYVGMSITATYLDGTVSITNVRSAACLYAGFVISGASNVQMTNISVGHNNASAYTKAGIWIANSTNVSISNYTAKIGGGTAASAAIGLLVDNGGFITIGNSQISYFYDGMQINSASQVQIVGNNTSLNGRRGIYVSAGDQVIIANNSAYGNGTGASTDAGIWDDNTAGYSMHNIIGNITTGPSGGVQDYGIYANITNNAGASGFTNITGNISKFNTTNLSTNGYTTNILATGNQN